MAKCCKCGRMLKDKEFLTCNKCDWEKKVRKFWKHRGILLNHLALGSEYCTIHTDPANDKWEE